LCWWTLLDVLPAYPWWKINFLTWNINFRNGLFRNLLSEFTRFRILNSKWLLGYFWVFGRYESIPGG
jgi:hypothetical protein